MKVEKNNNSIFRNKHVLVVVAVMCIFTIIACMGFMLSVPAHAEENIAPKTEPIAFSTPIETVNELDKAFPITETSEEAQEGITTAEVESSDAAEPEPRIETAEAAIEEAEPKPETIPDNLNDNELEIYTALRSAGLSKAGTAAVMGCMSIAVLKPRPKTLRMAAMDSCNGLIAERQTFSTGVMAMAMTPTPLRDR